jgi:2-dehydropantoate 2-reductase
MVEICQHHGTRWAVERMMREVLDIAAAVGSHPTISIERRLSGAERVGHHKTSMLQDFESGKQMELDAIIAAVVEIADMTGVEAPLLRTVHAAIDLLARTTLSRGVVGDERDTRGQGRISA